ncbi:MAG: imidazole glycerol phosphate synthase subunit HisF, partial [Chitinophagaceae bacterium]|nr:imidazole glycerol phosphate synthase subunit HisF [Chitinophagaceae bacterium]
YIGDPVNTVRIFNELEVDELCFLDIRATIERRKPNMEVLQQIANECFMPLSYGGGIKDFHQARLIMSIGFEKLVINTQSFYNPQLLTQLSAHFGAQAIIASIDVKKNVWGRYVVHVVDGSERVDIDVVEYAQRLQDAGAGEILLTSMDRDGTWSGFDLELTKKVCQAVTVPVIANGGAGSILHINEVVRNGHASAVALGSMVVYQQKGMGVLVNFPDKFELEKILQR